MFRSWKVRASIALAMVAALISTSRGAPRKQRHAARAVVLRFAVLDRPGLFYAYSQFVAVEPNPPARAPIQAATPTPAALPEQAGLSPASAVVRHCAKCHGGPAPKGGLALDGQSPLTVEGRLAAIRRVLADDPRRRMPPGEPLSPVELGLVLQDLATPPPEGDAPANSD